MDPLSRHHCLVYRGSPYLQLPSVAKIIRQKLAQNYRCLYLNSPSMVAGMKLCLTAADVDVAYECMRQSLVLSAGQDHLIDGRWFSVDRMMGDLEAALDQALNDGYAGLWATGDMTWELGQDVGSGKLLEYEWRLEKLFRTRPELGGVCQYHIDSLPGIAVQHGICTHPKVFVNDTLSMINPYFADHEMTEPVTFDDAMVDQFLAHVALCQ